MNPSYVLPLRPPFPPPISALPPPRPPKRATTRALLGDEYQEFVTAILGPPYPLQSASEYDTRHFVDGLKHADSTLRNGQRKLAPLGARALMLYKESCARLLDIERDETRNGENEIYAVKREWIDNLKTYEMAFKATSCLHLPRSTDTQVLQEKILELLRLTFFARYGNSLAETCRKLRNEDEAKKVEGWQTSAEDYWAIIRKKLEEEKPAHDRVIRGENARKSCPTYTAIRYVSKKIGISMQDILPIIHLYATRDELPHANFVSMIKDGRYQDLKKRLHDDYRDTILVIPPSEKFLITLTLKVINTTIDLLFNRYPSSPNTYRLWTASPRLQQYFRELRGPNPRSEADLSNEMSETLLSEMRFALWFAREEKQTVDEFHRAIGVIWGGAASRRLANPDLQAEAERARKMDLDWYRLSSIAKGVRRMSDVYYLSCGELGAPPNVVLDPAAGW